MSRKFRLAPNWVFPFRVGGDCVFVAQSVWIVRWQRDLTRAQKLSRAQRFWAAPSEKEKPNV